MPPPDWTIGSLRKHIERSHPGASFSDNSTQLLWQCFDFYAQHPFPSNPSEEKTEEKIDADAFQRALSLLAHQGTKLLGTQEEDDYFWRIDDSFFQKPICQNAEEHWAPARDRAFIYNGG
ncbi:uncharacterized protein BO97DRAFT_427790 [Aspergillus homomorphus CBS 101889]|uniref:Uncharacterized protein n=1 Tax=Aspergillus homomorphus (strain CBS 101889) TaxID=1450537 RepID=A0A395HMQ3_ASPHC|nr:hypothetical protein BO97DRAFT_427790 [Aspergillus homomorphus CBS 101889]RAL09117.1 hypothetical protein BO97DRAFT_427790 [Aspergillus homomorphus CBS 101889]